jgi:hypothetical protein
VERLLKHDGGVGDAQLLHKNAIYWATHALHISFFLFFGAKNAFTFSTRASRVRRDLCGEKICTSIKTLCEKKTGRKFHFSPSQLRISLRDAEPIYLSENEKKCKSCTLKPNLFANENVDRTKDVSFSAFSHAPTAQTPNANKSQTQLAFVFHEMPLEIK